MQFNLKINSNMLVIWNFPNNFGNKKKPHLPSLIRKYLIFPYQRRVKGAMDFKKQSRNEI